MDNIVWPLPFQRINKTEKQVELCINKRKIGLKKWWKPLFWKNFSVWFPVGFEEEMSSFSSWQFDENSRGSEYSLPVYWITSALYVRPIENESGNRQCLY